MISFYYRKKWTIDLELNIGEDCVIKDIHPMMIFYDQMHQFAILLQHLLEGIFNNFSQIPRFFLEKRLILSFRKEIFNWKNNENYANQRGNFKSSISPKAARNFITNDEIRSKWLTACESCNILFSDKDADSPFFLTKSSLYLIFSYALSSMDFFFFFFYSEQSVDENEDILKAALYHRFLLLCVFKILEIQLNVTDHFFFMHSLPLIMFWKIPQFLVLESMESKHKNIKKSFEIQQKGQEIRGTLCDSLRLRTLLGSKHYKITKKIKTEKLPLDIHFPSSHEEFLKIQLDLLQEFHEKTLRSYAIWDSPSDSH